jgi:hypothetical protein
MIVAAPVSMELSEKLSDWMRETRGEDTSNDNLVFSLCQRALAKTDNHFENAKAYLLANEQQLLEDIRAASDLESKSLGLWWHSITDR